jgi:uncharacterized protein (TIGR02996 family)
MTLLEAWELNPCAELAEAIEATPLDLSEIVAGDAKGGAAALAKLPARRDPRVSVQLIAWCATPPWHATGAQPFYRVLFERLEAIADPRAPAALTKARPALAVKIKGVSMRRWLGDRVTRCAAAIAAKYPNGIPAATTSDLALIESGAPLAGDKVSDATVAADALLAAIYADPADDGARQVYADVLTERGDPRGMFITMQLARSGREPTGKEMTEEMKILRKHARAWLGDVAPVLGSFSYALGVVPGKGVVFQRGFLWRVGLAGRDRDVARIAGTSCLATVENLALMKENGATLLDGNTPLPALRGLTVVPELVDVVVRSPIAKQLERLTISGMASPEHRRGAESTGLFPRLRELVLKFSDYAMAANVVASLTTAIAAKLPRVRVKLGNIDATFVRDPDLRIEFETGKDDAAAAALRALV